MVPRFFPLLSVFLLSFPVTVCLCLSLSLSLRLYPPLGPTVGSILPKTHLYVGLFYSLCPSLLCSPAPAVLPFHRIVSHMPKRNDRLCHKAVCNSHRTYHDTALHRVRQVCQVLTLSQDQELDSWPADAGLSVSLPLFLHLCLSPSLSPSHSHGCFSQLRSLEH